MSLLGSFIGATTRASAALCCVLPAWGVAGEVSPPAHSRDAAPGTPLAPLAVHELAARCAPGMPLDLLLSLVQQESAFSPLAIGVDAGEPPVAQPSTLPDAVATATSLQARGVGFSVGLAQIHRSNVAAYKITWEQAFHPCTNLSLAQQIFNDFHRRALAAGYRDLSATWAALRGYNSGSVDNAVSNRYANSILLRMASAPPAGAPQRISATRARVSSPSSPVPDEPESQELFDKPTQAEGGF